MWEVMFWPIVACVLLPWLLVYLGLHVVQRGIIFIDIAMAQMASLGICVAVLFRLDLESWTTFAIALAFTLTGAAIFSVTGKRTSQIPQEAVIGISYVVAAAAAVLLLSRAAEGDEEIKNMLVGNILLVTPREVWERFALFVAVGIFHFVFRRNFLLVSFDRDGAYQKRTPGALVGFFLLCRFWFGCDELRPDCRCVARLQLFDRPGGLRDQSRKTNRESPAHWLVHRASGRNRWIISVLLVGLTFRRSNRLHIWRVANSYFAFRVVAAAASSFCSGSGLIRQRWSYSSSSATCRIFFAIAHGRISVSFYICGRSETCHLNNAPTVPRADDVMGNCS